MKSLFLFLLLTFCYAPINLFAQESIATDDCQYSFDYSDTVGWTQVGSQVEIINGKVEFINGAPCGSVGSSAVGIQRRVYHNLGTTLNSADTWTAELEFTPISVGQHSNGNPHVGHNLFSLSETNQEPFNDCNDLPCNGFPPGTQDGIMLIYYTDNPPTGDIYFALRARESSNETGSPLIPANQMGTTFYIRVQRTSPTSLELGVFSDSGRTLHIPSSPVSFNIPATIEGLTTIQHGNTVRGQVERELTGSIDNLCINLDNSVGINEINQGPKELVKIVDCMGREVADSPNTVLFYMYSDGTTKKIFKAE